MAEKRLFGSMLSKFNASSAGLVCSQFKIGFVLVLITDQASGGHVPSNPSSSSIALTVVTEGAAGVVTFIPLLFRPMACALVISVVCA